MDKPLVSVIIVNWNGRRYLEDCLGSLSRSTYRNTEIIFVDNASSDTSVSYVRKNFSNIKIILNKGNLGFAEGHEVAYKKARGKALLLLSTDTIIEANAIEELVKMLYSEKDIGAVQPKLLMYPQKNLIDSIGSFFLMTGLLYHYGREKDHRLPIYNKPMEIFSAKGACILFRKEVLDKVGLFDKDYFAYFEETDLCHRIWLSGYKIVYAPEAVVFHKGGGASGQMVSSYIQFHSFKNRICTYLKNLSLRYLIVVMPLTILVYECTAVIFTLQTKFSLAWALQRSIVWNIIHLKRTLKKRKLVQTKIRVINDNDFLPKLIKSVRFSYYFLFLTGFGGYKD